MTPSIDGRITSWLEAVQYFLTNYVPEKNITKAVRDLGDTKLKLEKSEKQLTRRMNDAFSHCGKVFHPEETINMHIDGPTPTVKSPVQRFRNTHEGRMYMKMVQQATSEQKVFRIRTANVSRESIPRKTPVRQTRAVSMTQLSSGSNFGQQILGYGDAETHLIDDYYVPTSVSSSGTPFMTLSGESEEGGHDNQFLMAPTENRMAVPRVVGLVTNR